MPKGELFLVVLIDSTMSVMRYEKMRKLKSE